MPPRLHEEIYQSTECLVEQLDKLDQLGLQLTPGAQKIDYNTVIFDDCIIMKLNLKNSTSFEGVCDDEYIYFCVPRENTEIKVNGFNLSYRELYILAPGSEIKAIFPDNFIGFYLGINKKNLIQLLGEKSVHILLEQRERIYSGKFKFIEIEIFKNNLISSITYLLEKYSTLNEVSKLDIKDNILRSLKVLHNNNSIIISQNQGLNKSLAVTKRATNYIKNCTDSYISVIELCKNSYCSIRTLEYAFKRIYGISPKRYLMIRRLNFIRTDILTKRPKYLTPLLSNHGVVNLGRFSNDYYRFFGEYPKDTLKILNNQQPMKKLV